MPLYFIQGPSNMNLNTKHKELISSKYQIVYLTFFYLQMLNLGLNDMIRHPVSESFVHLKWNKVRKFFYFGLGYRLAFAICMTVAVIFVFGHNRTIAEWNKIRFAQMLKGALCYSSL